ncbi:phage integrase SAM-like domain-containing protein [Lewinella sp. JB7]|uniref:phage integrase SAM-like domain-containing protein n=1 Tax=Lewinella sp. JB7 TaxID=2962887 RepID=UPI0020CA2198|nr:phage integrase SAM-like domain-containing protein [Lewinella sp. JB7]MCP9237144.1 phage integrase SAM-like domain-containing protein [Lewinella sp. JB7]
MARKARFYLEPADADSQARISLRFSYLGNRIICSTAEHVNPKHWNKKDQRVQDKWCERHIEYLEVNRVLDDLDQFIRRTYHEHRRSHRLQDLTPDTLKALLRERIYGTQFAPAAPSGLIVDYYRDHHDQRCASGILSRETMNSDAVALDWFLRFAEDRKRPIYFRDVNLALFESYRDFFWNLPRERTDSTIHKMLRKFKQVCIHAAAHGHNMGCDVRAIQLKTHLRLSAQAMDTIALYEEELQHLAAFDWPGHIDHMQARDLFIAGCCTGLRVNRWPQIGAANIIERNGQRMLSLFTQKGIRKKVVIPLRPMLERIGERYNWKLPKHSPTMINRYIKEVCEAAGMTETIELARNVRGRSVLQRFRKFELITTHTARRSFATNAHAAGIHLDDIQAMTGHSDRKTLLHYIKEDAERRASRLKALPYYNQPDATPAKSPPPSLSA